MQKLLLSLQKHFIHNICIKFGFGLGIVVISGLIMLLSIKYGAMEFSFSKIVDILAYNLGMDKTPYWSKVDNFVIWELRLPRTILAMLSGAGLALAGVAMQVAVKNPLADPYVLGVSAGASAGATMVISMDVLDITAEYSVAIGAFCGAILSMLLVFLINKDSRDSVRLLLSGCVISIMFSSISSLMMFFVKDKEKISSVVFWLMGSTADANWKMIPIVFLAVVFAIVFLMVYHRHLNAMLLGEDFAHTLGVNVQKIRWQIIILVAFLVGSIVAFCGMIGFIGFVVPHIIRLIFGSNHKIVIPMSAIVGGIFLLCCDILAKNIVLPEELPIGIITSFLGAPFFIFILQCKSRGNN